MTISELATSKQTALRTLRAGGVILVYDDEYALHLSVLSRNERTRGDAERGRVGPLVCARPVVKDTGQ